MGWKKRDIITEAFNELGLGDYIFDVDPGQAQGALRRLDSMVAMWNRKSIRLGYPLPSGPNSSNMDDETNIQDTDINAVVLNLAVQIAPSFGKQVSVETKRASMEAYNTLLTQATQPREMQFPNNMPIGAGYKDGYHNDRRFFKELDPLDAGDDLLELL